jgi:hypothetical protein
VESFHSLSQKGGKRDGEYEEGHYLSVCVCVPGPSISGERDGYDRACPPAFLSHALLACGQHRIASAKDVKKFQRRFS